jgi:hypothetical protein
MYCAPTPHVSRYKSFVSSDGKCPTIFINSIYECGEKNNTRRYEKRRYVFFGKVPNFFKKPLDSNAHM